MKRMIINIVIASCCALCISLAQADSQYGRGQVNTMKKSSTSTKSKSGTPNSTEASGTPNIDNVTPSIGTGAPDIGTSTPSIGTGVPEIGTSTPGIGTGAPDIGSATPGIDTGIRGTSSVGGITSGSSGESSGF
jgi:hypothetical protein